MTEDATPRDDVPADAGAEAQADAGAEAQADAGAETAANTASTAAPEVKVPVRHPGYAFLAIVSMLTLAADLGSKWWAKARLEEPQFLSERKIVVIKGHLNLLFARNMGGAWGILQDESEAVRRPFFLLISVAAVVFIVSLYRKLDPRQWTLKWGLPLVLGGALGNLIDRLRYAYVVDFIQVWITPAIRWTYPWPTFNVADIAIVAGVALMFIDMFITRRPAAAPAEKG